MSKILEATCQAGVVKVGNITIPADILSAGVKSSTGLVILEGGKTFYVPNASLDLKELIEALADIVQQTITILTAIDGATNAPGANAAGITALTTAQIELGLMKENLR